EEVPPFGNFGVLCHEFGHLLGLPELYAPGGLPHEGIGVWGLMGQGTWLRLGERPPHPCAWSKLRLGWVDVETIERATRGVRLLAVEEVPRVVKIPASRGRPEEYYLVENRERIGADSGLPGVGGGHAAARGRPGWRPTTAAPCAPPSATSRRRGASCRSTSGSRLPTNIDSPREGVPPSGRWRS